MNIEVVEKDDIVDGFSPTKEITVKLCLSEGDVKSYEHGYPLSREKILSEMERLLDDLIKPTKYFEDSSLYSDIKRFVEKGVTDEEKDRRLGEMYRMIDQMGEE